MALSLWGERIALHLILNAYWEPLEFELPPHHLPWRRFLDTSQEAPNDICPPHEARPVARDRYIVADRSIVMLLE